MKMNKSWVGKKVRALNKDEAFAPYKGAIGTVVEFDTVDGNMPCKVTWDNTSLDVWVYDGSIELVENDSTTMPYDEIWEMLQPKMEKNGMRMFAHPTYGGLKCFYETDISQKAVALAYKMGYERAMKGRPFKYGERKAKKVEGHWEHATSDDLKGKLKGKKIRINKSKKLGDLNIFGMNPNNIAYVIDINYPHFSLKHNGKITYGSMNTARPMPDNIDYWVEGDDAD